MQVNGIVEHSAILSTFIKLPFVIKIFIVSIFEWPFYTGFTVFLKIYNVILPLLTAQYVNWNKHPVPVPPSSRLINMNNSTRA